MSKIIDFNKILKTRRPDSISPRDKMRLAIAHTLQQAAFKNKMFPETAHAVARRLIRQFSLTAAEITPGILLKNNKPLWPHSRGSLEDNNNYLDNLEQALRDRLFERADAAEIVRAIMARYKLPLQKIIE